MYIKSLYHAHKYVQFLTVIPKKIGEKRKTDSTT